MADSLLPFSPEAFTGPPDQEAVQRTAKARASAANHLRADLARLGRGREGLYPQLVDQVVHGYVPGKNEHGEPMSYLDSNAGERVAGMLESAYGTFEKQPGWRNADDYAAGGAQYAKTHADRHYGSQDEAYTASRQLLSPERYQYMQDVGRTADLLRGLRESPLTSLDYYKKSFREPLARDGLNVANYQRFGDGSVVNDFFADPTSPVAWYLRTSNLIPTTLRSMSDRASTALVNSAGGLDFVNRFRLGPVEVLDVPSDATPEQYLQRQAEVRKLAADIAPPSWQSVVGKAPPAVADATGFFGEIIDPSVVASLGTSGGAKILSGLSAKAAASAAPSLVSRATSAAGSMMRGGVQELKPEVMFAAPQWASQAAAPAERTWMEYFTGQGAPEQRDPAVTTRAADVLASLRRSSPQDIWNSRSLHNPIKVPVGREEDVGAAY